MGKSIKKGLFWKLLERGFTQGMLLLLTIILARLMDPKDFGTLALLMAFINLLQVFLDSGIGSALIQKKEVTDLEYSTVFYFNIAICIVLYILIFLMAPIVANIYNEKSYTNYIRVISIIILISGFRNIQNTKAAIDMDFRRLFFSTLWGVVISGIIGIIMAYRGYGIWALIAQNVINVMVATIILWRIDRWIPSRQFSFSSLKRLWGYGWKIFIANLIMTVYDNISVLLIGKKYVREELAFYDQGRKYPQVIISNINASVDSVIFPAMSHKQDDIDGLAELAKKIIGITEYILLPIMIGLSVCSSRIVKIILTEKWLSCVPYICIFCLYYLLYPFNTANINVLKAVGKSDAVLKLEFIKRSVGIVVLIMTLPFGVYIISIGLLICGIFDWCLNAIAVRKILKFGLMEEIRVIVPSIIMSSLMGVCVWFCGMVPISNESVILVLQLFTGGTIYLIMSAISDNKNFHILIQAIKGIFNKRHENI